MRELAAVLWSRHQNLADGELPIRDIGSNLVAMQRVLWPLPVWGLMPNILPDDARRLGQATLYPNKCAHTLQECDCPRSPVDVSVNSLYYIDAGALADSLAGGRTHYAVYFCNETFYGKFYDEAQWAHDADGTVTCQVFGDCTYRHARQQYLYTGSWPVGDGRIIVREVLARMEAHVLCAFTVTHSVGCDVRPATWTDVATRNAVADAVVFRRIRGVQTEFDPIVRELDIERLTVIADSVVLTRSTRAPVVICRAVLADLAMYANGKARTPDLMRDLNVMAARRYVNMNMPAEMAPAAATASATMAMSLNLGLEIQALSAYQSSWGLAAALHARLVAFLPLRRVPWVVAAALVAAALAASGAFLVFDPTHHHMASVVVAALLVAFLTVYGLAVWWHNYTLLHAQADWEANLRAGGNASYEGCVEQGVLRQQALKPAPPPKEDARLRIIGTERGKPWENKVLARAEGVVFDHHTPSVFGTGRDEEVAGLNGRVLKAGPEVDWVLWTEFSKWALSESDWLNAPTPPQPSWRVAGYWEAWLNTTKYNLSVKNKFREVWTAVRDLEVWDHLWNRVKAFVKFEFGSGKRTLTGEEAGSPRIIQGCQPEAVVVMGPTIKWIASWAKETLNGSPAHGIVPLGAVMRPFWAPGRTAEEIGDWAAAAEDAIPVGFWLAGDFSTFDAMYKKADRNLDTEWVDRMFQPDHFVLDCFNGQHPAGATWDGVAFETEDGLCSGEGATTAIGTKKNSELQAFSLNLFNLARVVGAELSRYGLPAPAEGPMVHYAVCVGGDDGLTRVSGKPEDVVPFMVAVMKKLGYIWEANTSDSLSLVDFYSKLFWPTAGEHRYVLAPKPGRLLSRVGWSLTTPDKTNLRGTFVSLGQDAAHVPFVRDYCEIVSPHLRRQKATFSKEHAHHTHAASAHKADWARTARFVRERYDLDLDQAVFQFRLDLNRAPGIPYVISSEVMDKLAEVDVEGVGTVIGRLRRWC